MNSTTGDKIGDLIRKANVIGTILMGAGIYAATMVAKSVVDTKRDSQRHLFFMFAHLQKHEQLMTLMEHIILNANSGLSHRAMVRLQIALDQFLKQKKDFHKCSSIKTANKQEQKDYEAEDYTAKIMSLYDLVLEVDETTEEIKKNEKNKLVLESVSKIHDLVNQWYDVCNLKSKEYVL